MKKYSHTTEQHNLIAPRQIVPFVLDLFSPQSVIDVGCGLGTFLRVFKENGVKEILGIDGEWCNKELLFQNIKKEEFLQVDLEKPFNLDRKFDLAVCLEVAEHLSEKRAESFVIELTKVSDAILFSAAIPNQGGENHFNEKWLDYWESIFSKEGYEVYDVLKPVFWGNKDIFWWYKQNMVIIINGKTNHFALKNLPVTNLKNAIHPELFLAVTDYREKNAIKRFKKKLTKSILYKVGLIK